MFKLGFQSLHELDGVHPALQEVVLSAIKRSAIDFSVHDGLRTPVEQAEYVKTGVSTTLKSKHLRQPDGFGHAVDLVPYINGKLRWEWEPIYQVAETIRAVAAETGVELVWGGVWDRPLSAINGSLKAAMAAYGARRRAQRARVFLDGPHFELAVLQVQSRSA